MNKYLLTCTLLTIHLTAFSWGFYGHRMINRHAVFLLPPSMLVFYKPHTDFITEHAIDADKRRYALADEGARHFIDMDKYGVFPYTALPRTWDSAVTRYGADSLQQHGIVPWWIQLMLQRLTQAFRERNSTQVLKLSADIGHYIGDAHVPLHASSNYNGQLTGQQGIHGFWESRIPELLAEKEWDFFIGRAAYIRQPSVFIWKCVMESARAADTVLQYERELSKIIRPDGKFAFEERNGVVVRQYSSAYTIAYNNRLRGMVERRMRQSIYAVASFWYTAWINAGQPKMDNFTSPQFTEADQQAFSELDRQWRLNHIPGSDHE